MTEQSSPTHLEHVPRPRQSDSLRRVGRTLTEEPESIFRKIRDLPGVRSWKILNDVVFLALSGVLGILWFVVAVVGFAVGTPLLVVGVGVPILALAVGTLVWGAHL